MIQILITELVRYGIENQLIDAMDEIYVRNRLMELLRCADYSVENQVRTSRPIHEILNDILDYAVQEKIIEDGTITEKDLFDTKVMGMITPPPSVVQQNFVKKYKESPEVATEYFYALSQATNYIRKDRIKKDEKWVTNTEYGLVDITINLSKPEKDPRDIAKAGKAISSDYPKCLLCKENEGFAGHLNHPARQNHRIVPLTLDGETYYLQYSPYVYYNEHCIIFNKEHIPMKIDKAVFQKLLSFVRQFPHYTAGSNADLPIVGGSILSHDHFQGGNYIFPMAKAPYETTFTLNGWPNVVAGIIKWPLSVIRLQSNDTDELVEAADHILKKWRGYTDEAAFIFCETEGIPHNTITPIARTRGEFFELDLVLRNNITTKEHPMGVYHPHAQYHHIKKENIGLIEVMGLAVLPARLKKEMELLEHALLTGQNLREDALLEKHAEWAEQWSKERTFKKDTIHKVVQDEIGKVFVKVLECAGVYKGTKEGRRNFECFIKTLN